MTGVADALPFTEPTIRNLDADEVERYAYIYAPKGGLFGQTLELALDTADHIGRLDGELDDEQQESMRLEGELDEANELIDQLKGRSRALLRAIDELVEQDRLELGAAQEHVDRLQRLAA